MFHAKIKTAHPFDLLQGSLKNRILMLFGLGLAIALYISPAQAASGGQELDLVTMIMTLAGGLAVFLFGMEQMGESLKVVAGDRMKDILAKLTTNRFMGMITGAFVTAIIQSSSVTTVMLVGFVSANLMSLSQSVGVIFGANIGTTITAQIIAFKVTKYSMLLVAVGFGMLFIGRKEKIKLYGALIMGLGLVFFGLSIMSDGMRPLRTYEPFIALMQDVSNPVIGILVALAFTALVQSSSATTGVVLAMSIQGLITLEGGIALLFGANVGTCVTAGLASLGKPREAVRVALAHTTFNVGGVLIMVWFIPYLAEFVRYVSPSYPGLGGMERLAAEVPRQVANAHSIFNISMSLLFLPLAPLFARFCEWAVPEKVMTEAEIEEEKIKTRYLDDTLLITPVLALDRVSMETERIARRVRDMYYAVLPATLQGSQMDLDAVAKMDDEVDALHEQTVTYMQAIGVDDLSEEKGKEFFALLEVLNYFEQIGDLIETDLVGIGEERLHHNLHFTDNALARLTKLHGKIGESLDYLVEGVTSLDSDAAIRVITSKEFVDKLVDEATHGSMEGFVANTPTKVMMTYNREREVIERLKRIYYFLKRIAKLFESVGDKEMEEERRESA